MNEQEKSYQWCLNCIKTSVNHFHLEACIKIVELYFLKYKDEMGKMELLLEIKLMEDNINFF
jgi:hypothetical protein